MKRLIIQLILAMLIPMAANANELCKMTSTHADANSGEISFEVEVKEAGTYFLQLWQCPAKLSDGQLQSYAIEIDGKRLSSDISPEEAGWGYLSCAIPTSVKVGKINVSIKSSLPAVPNVEFVELISAKSVKTHNSATQSKYDNYIADIKRSSALKSPGFGSITPTLPKDTVTIITDVDLSTTQPTPYNYHYRKIAWFGYTFYTTAYFKEGQEITCSSLSKENVSHFLEIFSSTSTNKHSWVKLSDNNGNTQLSITIPESGIYYVKVRPFKNGSTGLCNVNINNIMSYENVPMCTMGVSGDFKFTAKYYNIFTTNSESDPILWVNKGGTYDGFVYAFNDDYESSGDFDWGKNARIAEMDTPLINKILISSARSFDPIGQCELYIGCKDFVRHNTPFENLRYDDAMVTAPKSETYNCYAWSGGISSAWLEPSNSSSPYYVEGGTALDAFDNYYYSERYPGCTRYIRSNETIGNNQKGVDLWSKLEFTQYNSFTHASISRNSDSNPHGYDWESKLGKDFRIFHPRHALSGNEYGHVVYHYVPIDDGIEKISLEEAIANGVAVMDNPVLSENQEQYISEGISAMPQSDYNSFNSIYDEWQNIWDNSLVSSKESFQNESEYQTLLQACKSNPAYMLLVYDKINKGIYSAIPLFEDLVVMSNSQNSAKMRAIHKINNKNDYDEAGRKIFRTNSSNLKLLLKQLIPDSSQKIPGLYGEPAQCNSTDENSQYNVHLTGNQVYVNLTLDRTADVSIDILDLECNSIGEIKGTNTMDAGSYNFTSTSLRPGTYLIRCLINGCLRVKKVIIQ